MAQPSLFRKKIVQILWLVLGLYACIALSRSLAQLYQASRRVTTQETKLSELKSEVAGLKTQLEEVESWDFLEKQARNELGLQRPGEIVLVLPPTNLVVNGGESRSEVTEENWQKWLKLFN